MGIIQDIYQMPADTKQQEALDLIDKLNANPDINGVMVQLPAPEQIDADELLERIDPNKDVDGLTLLTLVVYGWKITLLSQLLRKELLRF